MINIREHGGSFGGKLGKKIDPTMELLVSSNVFAKETYTAMRSGNVHYLIAASEKYIVYRRDYTSTREFRVIDRKTDNIVGTYNINIYSGYSVYVDGVKLMGALNGDWLYFVAADTNGNSILFGINVLIGQTSMKSMGMNYRFENLRTLEDGYTYGVSYSYLIKLDGAGNLVKSISLPNNFGGGGGYLILGIINNELIIGTNSSGWFSRFALSTLAHIGNKQIEPSLNMKYIFELGGFIYAGGGSRLTKMNYDYTDVTVFSPISSAHKVTKDYFIASILNTSSSDAIGTVLFDKDFNYIKMISGYRFQSTMINYKADEYIELLQGGGGSDSARYNSLVKIYMK